MKRILALVEGQTEETFVRDVLKPHFHSLGKTIVPKILVTKKRLSGKQFKGGITSYARVKADLLRLLRDTDAEKVTTILDYYALPADFPGLSTRPSGSDPYPKVRHLQAAFAADVNHTRFVPYFSLHEFEALIFVDPGRCEWVFDSARVVAKLRAIRGQFPNAEWIDDGPTTAPSKRIIAAYPEYQKDFHGPLAADAIGLDAMRADCPHFAEWLGILER